MVADPCAYRTPRPGTKMPDTDTGFSGIIKTVKWYIDNQDWCKKMQDTLYKRERQEINGC